MKRIRDSRLFRLTGLLLGALVWLANNSNPPNGRTGAPFDGHCNDCHNGSNPNNFNGLVEVSGMPGTVEPNTTYPLVITLTPTAGSPTRGGFQLVAVDNNNANCGNLTASNTQSGTEMSGGREYLDQRGGKVFGGNPVSWNFTWQSPASVPGNTVKFYFIGNFTNGNGGTSGDFPIAVVETYPFSGPPPVSASIGDVNNVSCFGGNNGSIMVEPAGGTPPYTYLWSNGQTTQTAINLTAGNYTVTVTAAGGGGTATATAGVTQPTLLVVSASAPGSINCFNPTVTATATASGGTPGYSYSWSDGQTGNQAIFSSAGTYSVIVTDNNGCTKSATVTVSANVTTPNAVAGPSANLTCTQTSATLNGTGSSSGPTYSYLWTTPTGNIVSGATTLMPVVNAAGTYTLQVTNNNNGCTSTASTTVTSSITPPTAAATGGQLTCNNPTVQIVLTTNASQPTFTWSGPGNFMSNLQNPTVSALGTYQVTVTNGSTGCSTTTTANVTQNTTIPSVSATAAAALTCSVGTTTIAGNSSAGTYSWTGPGGFTSSVQNPSVTVPGVYTLSSTAANGCMASDTALVVQNITPPGATASTNGQLTCAVLSVQLSGSSPAQNPSFGWTGPNGFTSNQQNPTVQATGDYILTVTSAQNGCSSTSTTSVSQNIAPPTASAVTPVNLTCASPTIQLNATASSQGANFSYQWTTNNGNIVSGANTLTPTVNNIGTYHLLVTNGSNGCTSTATVIVNQNPPVTAAIAAVTSILCNGGTNGAATAMASGGNNTYTYLWSTGAPVATVNNLPAGVYTVTITDGENCTATAVATINQPALLAVNATATAETAAGANNGTATAAPSGGTTPYTYLWNTNATTPGISNLAPGNYTVTITDANSCTAVQTVTVNSFNCALTATIAGINISCNGANNGSATVNLTGAAQPVSFLWSNGAMTQTVNNLAPNNYTVQITDANNCPAQLSVSITEPTALLPNATGSGETAAGADDGTASAQPTGGTAPYTFLWSNGDNTATIDSLSPGTYTVSVSDANSCTAVQTVTVNAFNCALAADYSLVNVACAGAANGQATITINGGTLPFDYQWSHDATTATATGLAEGVYTVTVTDASDCVLIGTVTITEPDTLTLAVSNVSNVVCPEDHSGSAEFVTAGGTLPYQLSWPAGQSGQNLGVGSYTVTLTDANGCSAAQTVTIISTDNQAPVLTCPAVTATACPDEPVEYDQPTFSDNCQMVGALPILTEGLPSGSVFPVGTTTLAFQISDASGNTATCSFSIAVEAAPVVSISASNDVNNLGSGTISVDVPSGGAGATFNWEKDGVFFSNQEDLTGLFAGSYGLTLITANGCSYTFPPVIVDNTVGANEPNEPVSLRLWPNPVRYSLRLEVSGASIAQVQLFDARGRLLRDISAAEYDTEILVEALPGGLYYLGVAGEDGHRRMLKFIKMD